MEVDKEDKGDEMRNGIKVFQIATVFVGSIVGAGLSSGRELNQFFSVYGYKSVVGLILCGLSYMIVGKMIVEISKEYGAKSYSEFVSLVCHRKIALFTNITLTLFLISSTSIIFAGSSAVIHQYFGIPKWIGLMIMMLCSSIFLLRKTSGLFEVNSFVVPCLIVVMTAIFIGFLRINPNIVELEYIQNLPVQKHHFLPSTIIYSSFNIISIIGILVPLANELKDHKIIIRGIVLGSVILTLISFFIAFLMLLNPSYPKMYEIPILAVAGQVGEMLQVGLMAVIWLEMFSSQVSNIYSLTKSMESQFNVSYTKGIFLVFIIAMPMTFIGFSRLVEILYPLYGVLSLLFMVSCVHFYFKKRISITLSKKHKQRISPLHKI